MTLLIDGDMIAYRSTVAVEKDTRFLDRYHILFSSFDDGWHVMLETLGELTDLAETDDVLFCFSDPTGTFRHKLARDYKGHRRTTRKPLAYWDVVEGIKKRYPYRILPNLEADDTLGILMTNGEFDDPILWSLDKDLKQIPGRHLRDDEVVEVTPEEGDLFHLYQTLAGDTADGYPGCPGIGETIAWRVLENRMKLVPYEHVLKAGKNKGKTEIRYEEVPTDDLWEVVVSHFEKAGLTEEDALEQARIARILQANSYDNGEITLWTPSR
ncbi:MULTISPECIES: hypothetical protein [unclassified Aminobacter]|uniref:hypothetical protein n=1 Tax=unclassified Aminobacter TaxID=2644704 RepID=UPI000463C9A4|nr:MULTISPECIES: hypothetical protein [unclassified Aminobacter]TWH35577.1 DNA polymerase-1 [Aminobacter sp. J15]